MPLDSSGISFGVDGVTAANVPGFALDASARQAHRGFAGPPLAHFLACLILGDGPRSRDSSRSTMSARRWS